MSGLGAGLDSFYEYLLKVSVHYVLNVSETEKKVLLFKILLKTLIKAYLIFHVTCFSLF